MSRLHEGTPESHSPADERPRGTASAEGGSKRPRDKGLLLGGLVLGAILFLQWPMLKGLYYRASSRDAPESTIAWRNDFHSAVAEAEASAKPLLLVFSASWCPPCIVMKHEVWPDAEVSLAVNNGYVPLLIDVDDSRDNLISDAIRHTANVDIGFTNGFRFAPPIVAGPVTQADLWNLLPLDTRLKKGWVTGKELREYLERELELVFSRDAWKLSGGWGPQASVMEMSFEAQAAAGKRLKSVKVNGEEVAEDRKYTIAGCEREGEPLDFVCRLRGTHEVEYVKPTIHQAMETYLLDQKVIAPIRQRRSRATDLPEVAFSQDQLLASFSR